MSKRTLLLILQIAFYIVLIGFVVQKFDELTNSVNLNILLDKPFYVVFSIICFLIFYALLSLHWKLVCDKYEKFQQNRQWLAFFASQPYKYLPTSIFTFSSRAVYSKRLGLPIKQSSAVQLIENLNILLGSFVTALLFLIYNESIPLGFAASVLLILILSAVCFVPTLKIPKTALRLSGKEWVKLFLLSLTAWMVAGTAFYFIVLATGQQIDFASAVTANAIAVGLGILAVFAPAGIGVREFVYNKFGITNTGIIVWRLLTLLIDVVVGFMAIYWIKRTALRQNNT